MARLVTVRLSPIFRNFRGEAERLRDEIVTEGGVVFRRETESSMRQRWFRTGKAVSSLTEQVVSQDDSKTYQLAPTATSDKGAPYPLFGEYGTGRRGAASGRPAPQGYRYGDQSGMRARRFSRIAVAAAKPQVEARARQLIANFTIN